MKAVILLIKYKDKFGYSVNPLMYVSSPLIDSSDTYYSAAFMTLCAEKWLAPFVENIFGNSSAPYETLGMLIQNKFSAVWTKVNATLEIEYNPLTDYRILGSESRASSDTTISNSGNTVIDKVTSFDAGDDFINDNKSIAENTATNNNSATANLTTQKEGIIGKTPIQEYIRREIALRASNDMKDIIIRDTISYICLPIY